MTDYEEKYCEMCLEFHSEDKCKGKQEKHPCPYSEEISRDVIYCDCCDFQYGECCDAIQLYEYHEGEE